MAVADAVRAAQPVLLEPVMEVCVQVPDKQVGAVLSDLSGHRRARVVSVDSSQSEQGVSRVVAHAPLAKLIGYSTLLRSMTAGEASFTMELVRYGAVGEAEQQRLVENPP